MSLTGIVYSTDTDNFFIDGVKAGDTAAMESKLQALIDSSGSPAQISELELTGVEQGPEWEATLVFGTSASEAQRADSRVVAAVGGNKTEAYSKLLERLAAEHAVTQIDDVHKIEIAGGGASSRFMALALVSMQQG